MTLESIRKFEPLLRGYAVSLGALAMFVVAIRGAIWGQQIDSVAKDAMVALLLFTAMGAVAAWIAEYLVKDTLERAFRSRVEWYRQGIEDVTTNATVKTKDE